MVTTLSANFFFISTESIPKFKMSVRCSFIVYNSVQNVEGLQVYYHYILDSSSRFIDITFHKIYTYTDMGEEFSSNTNII